MGHSLYILYEHIFNCTTRVSREKTCTYIYTYFILFYFLLDIISYKCMTDGEFMGVFM